jgi:hypothetical protein
MEYSQTSAALIFTASTVMIVISIMLMASAWKSLKEIMAVLPTGQRRIYHLFKLRDIEDKQENEKEVLKNFLWIGAFVLGINIFVNIVSLIAIAALFVGLNVGIPEVAMQNFNGARYMLFISPLLLCLAILLIGTYRFFEFLEMKSGRIDPYRWRVEEKAETSANEDAE